MCRHALYTALRNSCNFFVILVTLSVFMINISSCLEFLYTLPSSPSCLSCLLQVTGVTMPLVKAAKPVEFMAITPVSNQHRCERRFGFHHTPIHDVHVGFRPTRYLRPDSPRAHTSSTMYNQHSTGMLLLLETGTCLAKPNANLLVGICLCYVRLHLLPVARKISFEIRTRACCRACYPIRHLCRNHHIYIPRTVLIMSSVSHLQICDALGAVD